MTSGIEFKLIAGKALANAKFGSADIVTAEDVALAASETAKQLVAAHRLSEADVQARIAEIPPAWKQGFDATFFRKLDAKSQLGVDLGPFESIVAGVAAAVRDASIARRDHEQAMARVSLPHKLTTVLQRSMVLDEVAEKLQSVLLDPLFCKAVGGQPSNATIAGFNTAVYALAGDSIVGDKTFLRDVKESVRVPVYELPLPTPTHELALLLLAAKQVGQVADGPGYGTALLGQQFLGGTDGVGQAWRVYIERTKDGYGIGIAVNTIDEARAQLTDPPPRDAAMEARVSDYVRATAKKVMDAWNAGTPMLQIDFSRRPRR